MGQSLKCCCENKIPELKLSVNSNCCQGNKYVITIKDEDEIQQVTEMLKELHRNSQKKLKKSNSLINNVSL